MDFVLVVTWMYQISEGKEKVCCRLKIVRIIEQQELLCYTKHWKRFGERLTGTDSVMKVRGWKWEESVWGVMEADSYSVKVMVSSVQGWVSMPKRWGENKFPLPERLKTNSCDCCYLLERVNCSYLRQEVRYSPMTTALRVSKSASSYFLMLCFFHPINLKGYLDFLSLPLLVIACFDNSA